MLRRHETTIRRRLDAIYRSASPRAMLLRWLGSPVGNYLVNTPLYLLPDLVNLQAKHRVLEVGCNQGANLAFLTTRIAFNAPPVGLDLSSGSLRATQAARPDAPFRLAQGSASRLPFPDEAFDLVLAAHTVRHLNEEGLMRFIMEAHRVLRPGGLLAIWDYAPTSSPWLNRLNRAVLERLGAAGKLRAFPTFGHLVSEAHYDVIERPKLRPFLFPPVPRTAILAKKAGIEEAEE